VAHCSFSYGKEEGSVIFRRAVASKELKVENIEWSNKKFQESFEKTKRVKQSVHQLIEELKPYEAEPRFL
jgi:hypothetical protein